MFCPQCRSEYREGFTWCAPCDVALVDELPDEGVFATPESMAAALADKEVQPLLVGTLQPLREAMEKLRQARILCALAAEQDEVGPGMQRRLYLMVADEDFTRAREELGRDWESSLVREGLSEHALTGDDGDCPACGAALPEEQAECPDCGLVLG